MTPPFRSLLGRTLATTVLTVLFTHFATSLVIYQFYVKPLLAHDLEDRALQLKAIMTAMATLDDPVEVGRFIRNFDDSSGGKILSQGPNLSTVRPPFPGERLYLIEQHLKTAYPQMRFFVSLRETSPAVWVELRSGWGTYWYVTQRQLFDAGFPEKWGLLLTLVILVSMAGMLWAVRRINQPLQELTRIAHQIAEGQPGTAVAVTNSPIEIQELGDAFDTMQKSLAALESNRILMLAGVSHDLRTPLSRLRLSLEMLQVRDSRLLDPLIQDLEEIDRIIDQFLDFARPVSAQHLKPGRLDELLRSCQERYLLRQSPVELETVAPPPVMINERALERVIINLIENALRYGRPPIRLVLDFDPDWVILKVQDHGDGIPPSEVKHLLQPFTRSSDSRSGPPGAGLGLAIVARIVEQHRGELTLQRPTSGGFEVVIHLPRIPST